MADRIEKRVELKAPVSRVWRALTDSREFGAWFLVNIKDPFIVGQTVRGQCAYPGFEHIRWEAHVEKMEPERLFSFTWPLVEFSTRNATPATTQARPERWSSFSLRRLRPARSSH